MWNVGLQAPAVRVSLVSFSRAEGERHLDGKPVATINADLTADSSDLTQAKRLPENAEVSWVTPRAARSMSRETWPERGSKRRSIQTGGPIATCLSPGSTAWT